MLQLNLPSFDYQIKKADGKVWIFDGIRKKYVVLTPEEWVRQHFVNYLITEKKYSKSLMKIESGLKFNSMGKRSDIIVYDREAHPWLVVECKSPDIKLNDEVAFQASVYNSTLKAPFVAVTNGIYHRCASIDWVSRTWNLMDSLPDFPDALP